MRLPKFGKLAVCLTQNTILLWRDALRKDGSLRFIAIGNVLRRLISKAISPSLGDRAATQLSPNQLGVEIRGGAKAAVYSARYFLSQCSTS